VWTAFTAGVVTTEVARLHVRSAVEGHDIEIEERIGAFVALTVHGREEITFRLIAYDADGREIDSVDYRDPWSIASAAAT
jgi:hypothetical protein